MHDRGITPPPWDTLPEPERARWLRDARALLRSADLDRTPWLAVCEFRGALPPELADLDHVARQLYEMDWTARAMACAEDE